MEIRGLSLTQPWASLVVERYKRYETRSWTTQYRGIVAIHASKSFPRWAQELAQEEPFLTALNRPREEFHTGVILGMAELIHISPTERLTNLDSDEQAFGDFNPGRFAWHLEGGMIISKPIPWKGALGLWRIDQDVDLCEYLTDEWLKSHSNIPTF